MTSKELEGLRRENALPEERVHRLAQDKSYLQLVISLINKITAVSGLDNLADSFLQGLLDVIGGTNLALYYRTDGVFQYTNLGGDKKQFDRLDDEIVSTVFSTGTPVELELEPSATQMTTSQFGKACTWVYPLSSGSEVVGVVKIENLHLSMQDISLHLLPLFNYIAMALKNEISGQSKLKIANDDLTREVAQRRNAEELLRRSHELLEMRVAERTAELQEANSSLRSSHEAYKCILETTSAGFWHTDINGKILGANPRYAWLSGYSEAELLTMRIGDLEARESQADTAEHLQRMMISGFDHFTTRHRRKDGSIWEVDVNCSYLDSEGGHVFAFLRDITETKRADEALKKHERILAASQHLAQVGGWEWDAGLKSMYWTEEIYRIHDLEIPPDGADNRDLIEASLQCNRPEDRQVVLDAFQGCADSGQGYDLVFPFTSFAGRRLWVRTSAKAIRQDGHIVKVVGSLMDISELKKHENELLKIEKLESLGVLAGGIAHDFNNILTAIMGNISLVRMFLDDSHPAYKPLVAAEKASARAGALAHQLLTFARGGEPVKSVVSLKVLVQEAVSLILRGSNVKGTVSIPDSVHAVEADEGQLSQICNNITINAIQAMPAGGEFTVSADNEFLDEANALTLPAGPYVKLVFADDGVGISEEDQTRIFDPYFTTKQAGSGLGLASVHSIVNRHGGNISVSSIIGQGTTFTIYLPSLGKTYQAVKAVEDIQALKQNHRGGTVLVMDDEEIIRDLAAAMLAHLGYQAQTCATGAEAVVLYKAALEAGHRFDAVVTDLTIPGGMGGRETARQILAFDPNAYLIVSSGYSNDPIMADFKAYGFRGAVSKPYNLSQFQNVLKSLAWGEA